ncbi:ITA8 protein, partial [Calyptomena viridis]|nr:ITA8 protein [Calyptomena viridis]
LPLILKLNSLALVRLYLTDSFFLPSDSNGLYFIELTKDQCVLLGNTWKLLFGHYMKIRQKRKAYAQWKKGLGTWKEYRDAAYLCREKICVTKAQLRLKLARNVEENNKSFFKYITGKRQCRNNITLLQDGDGHLTNRGRDRGKVFNAFFTSALNMDGGPRGSHCPELENHDSENDQLPVNLETVQDLLLQLEPYKSIRSDRIHPRILKELVDFANDTELGGAVDSLEGREALQRDLEKLERWAITNYMKFNKGKYRILHLRWGNHGCMYRLGNEVLESSTSERDLGVLVSRKLNLSQQCPGSQEGQPCPGGHQAKHQQADEGGDCPALLCSALVGPHLEYCGSFGHHNIRKTLLESIQRRAMRMVNGLEGKLCEEQLRSLDLFSLEKRRLRGDIFPVFLVRRNRDHFFFPDLIVGAFGAGKAVVYRARPVVTVNAHLILNPMIVNPDNKTCQLADSQLLVACFTVRVCADFEGQSISDEIVLKAELQLDSLKQKGAVKRTLFFDYHQSHHYFSIVIERQKQLHCQDFLVYLRDETEFRDKLSPININLNYSLDESSFEDSLTVKPILNYYQKSSLTEQAYILVDCGEDNLCIPDLQLSAMPDTDQLIIGEENCVILIINPRNDGEGAYEAELHIKIPPEADYTGVERNNKALRVLSCDYKMENETRMVVCDLGNPMVAGANFSTGIRFSVQHFENADFSINFELQIKSSNKINPTSNLVNLHINISAVAQVQIRGVSHPPTIILPLHNWEPKDEPTKEEEVGPLVEHIYELHNIGPSAINNTVLHVGWPVSSREEFLLYILHIQTHGPLHCQTSSPINTMQIKFAIPQDTPELAAFLYNSTISHYIRRRDVAIAEPHRKNSAKILNCTNVKCVLISCTVGQLERGKSAALKIRSRLWAQTFLE